MVISKINFKIIISALLLASMIPLCADPDQSDSITNEPESAITSNELVSQCHFYAEQMETTISLIINLYTSQGDRLVSAIDPIISLCENILKMPNDACQEEVHHAFALLNQSAVYLTKALENEFTQGTELTFEETPREQVTNQDIAAIFTALNSSLASLMAKTEERFQDLWGTMTMHLRTQLNKLDTILQTINTNIANNSTIVNKEDLKKEIMGLRNTLRFIQKDINQAASKPETVMAVYKINKAIVTYLQDAQLHKFRKWAQLDLAEAVRGKDIQSQTLEEILMRITETNADLEQLEKDAEKIDLTLANRAARFVGDYVIDPVQKYDLGLYGLATAFTFGVGGYTAYFFDQTFYPNPQSWFRKLVGYRDHKAGKMINIPDQKVVAELAASVFSIIQMPMDTEKLTALAALNEIKLPTTREDQLSAMDTRHLLQLLLNQANRAVVQPIIPISKMDEFISEHKNGAAAIGIALLGLTGWAYYKIWHKYSDVWSKKIMVWFKKLQGGSFAKTAEKFDVVYPTTTFDDIIGLEYEKSLIYPHLKYIKDPERWDANELTPPTGILLTGPTRSGKTFFAKAICGELHKQNPEKTIRFITIDAHDIKAEGISSWMHIAKVLAPCVLFIDEIDLLGLQRSQDKTLLADFLQALSGIADKDPKKQVIVIGTTNKPENIDTAMLQSGRLALEIRFKYPNMQERKEFIKKRLDKFAIDPEVFEIDIDKLVRETHEKSFEDIKLMIDTAFIHVGIKGSIISQDILEWALDTQLRKIIDIDSKQISDDEKRVLAAHYAGQVLTQHLLDMDEKIAKVTIRQVVIKVKEESVYEQYYAQEKQKGIDQGAVFTYLNHDTLDIKSQEEMCKKAKTLLGARIAERLITHSTSTFFGWKKNSAFNMIKSIVADGIDLKSLSKSGQNALSDEAQIKLKQHEQDIEQLLLQHLPALHALTDALQSKQTLTIGEITDIISKAEFAQQVSSIDQISETMVESIA